MTKKKEQTTTKKTTKPTNVIKNCNFIGTQWDGKALETVQTVADALLKNAEALNNLAKLFISQPESIININC